MYLLDTDTLSNLMKKSPSNDLQARLLSVPVADQFTSSVTLGELLYGAQKKGSKNLPIRIEREVTAKLTVLPFDSEAAMQYGEVRTELESRGIPIGQADTMIAAIALARGLIVITGNIRHFQRVPGLTVENWL